MRSVEEWIGDNDNQAIPARVRVRIFDECNGRCRNCDILIVGGVRPAIDHVIAIANGGPNAERNLQLLCVTCHAEKTKRDVAEKSTVYRKRLKHLGLKPKGRPMAGSRSSNVKFKIGGGWEYRK